MLDLRYFAKSILRSWKHHITIQLASLLVLSSALTVVFSFYLVFSNLERLVVSWGSELEMSIYLEDDMDKKGQAAVERSLYGLNKFRTITLQDKKTTTESFSYDPFQKL